MFDEDERRVPADDTLTVVRGHFGSYPNFFFEVDARAELDAFADELARARERGRPRALRRALRHPPHGPALLGDVGLAARRPARARSPIEAGVYDLGRYGNL